MAIILLDDAGGGDSTLAVAFSPPVPTAAADLRFDGGSTDTPVSVPSPAADGPPAADGLDDGLAARIRELEASGALTYTGEYYDDMRRLGLHAALEDLPDEAKSLIEHYGPFDRFMRDPSVTEVTYNGYGCEVQIRRGGRIGTGLVPSRSWVDAAIAQMLRGAGLPAEGMLRFMLERRFRVAVTLPGVTLAPTLTIRCQPAQWFKLRTLIGDHVLSEEAAALLLCGLDRGVTVLISGGAHTGKSTLLVALLYQLAEAYRKRLVLVEDPPELPAIAGAISLNVQATTTKRVIEAVRFALLQGPDHIIVAETRDSGALAFCQAGASGHSGATTIHAESTHAAMLNIERLACEAGEVPAESVRAMLAGGAVPLLVVQMERNQETGTLRVVEISETLRSGGRVGEPYTLNPLFQLNAETDLAERTRYSIHGSWAAGLGL